MNNLFPILMIALVWTSTILVASAFVGVQIPSRSHLTGDRFKTEILQRMTSGSGSELEIPDKAMEEVWRYAKKPLISVGGKGATDKHGNSLRQLLDDHTIVKVKVNTKSFGTLENAYERLRELAIESGASQDIELIQMREKDRTIMFGLPGTLKNVQNGSFPPLEDDDDDEDAE